MNMEREKTHREVRHDGDTTTHRLFCCCEYTDRHGQRAHLSDAAVCDACAHCKMPSCEQLAADVDDRVRMPMYGGAVHLGLGGALPLIAIPLLHLHAAKSAAHALGVTAVHAAAWAAACGVVPRLIAERLGARFSPCWAAGVFFHSYAVFTLYIGEHLWFGSWLLVTALILGAALHAHAAISPPKTAEEAPLQRADSASDADEPSVVARAASEGVPVAWLGGARVGRAPLGRCLFAALTAMGAIAALSVGWACAAHRCAPPRSLLTEAWSRDDSARGVGLALACQCSCAAASALFEMFHLLGWHRPRE